LKYFRLKPEVAGGFGERTVIDRSGQFPEVKRLHYVFEDWLGDDLVTSFPCYIITDRLKDWLEKGSAGGYKIDRVTVSESDLYKYLHPNGPRLPQFHWLKITGQAGSDDFGLAKDHRLVVSERALQILQCGQFSDCLIEDYPDAESGSGGS
jgi:hypothetical protein